MIARVFKQIGDKLSTNRVSRDDDTIIIIEALLIS